MRRLVDMGSSAVAVGASLAAKSILLLAVSAYAYATLQDRDVVAFFQLLFLQGVIVTFVGAAGFFGAMGGDGDPRQERARVLASAKLAVLAMVLASAFSLVNDFGAPPAGYTLMCIGGVATGLSAPLSGLAARTRGYWSAFGPAVVTSIAALPLLVLLPVSDHVRIYAALVASQVAYAVWLAHLNRTMLFGGADASSSGSPSGMRNGDGSALAYGALNTVTLVTILYVREAWSELAAPALVASVFFALRVSDTALQVLTMVLVPSVKRLLDHPEKLARFAVGAVTASAVGLLVIAVSPNLQGSWLFVIVALAGLELVRLPSSLTFVAQMIRRSPRQYAVYVGASAAVGLSVFHLGSPSWPALLHLTLGAMSFSALVVTLASLRGRSLFERTHQPHQSSRSL